MGKTLASYDPMSCWHLGTTTAVREALGRPKMASKWYNNPPH